MGFVNTRSGAVGSFCPAGHLKAGGISLIAHSGSVFTVVGMNDPRFRFDLMVSTGQEIGAGIDEYITHAAGRDTTRAIAVFMEAARNPQGLIDSLHAARARGIPVIVCKIGRTEESARLARSHTGALVGSTAAYAAVFEECGAIMVDSVDAPMNTALLCSTGRVPGPGGLGLVTDSGGLRELQVDLAAETATPLACLSDATRQALRATLPAELEPSNPLDCAADLTDDYAKVFADGLRVLAAAPEVSMLGLEVDFRDDYIYEDRLLALARSLPEMTAKPCFVYSSFGLAHNRRLVDELADLGLPTLNGAGAMMTAARNLRTWAMTAPSAPDARRSGPGLPAHLDEETSLGLLRAYGMPTAESIICDCARTLRAAAERLGFPLVLKTAEAGIDHKSDRGGVILNLRDMAAAARALSAFSHACAVLSDRVSEIDVNPVVVTQNGAVAVDALIVPATDRPPEAMPQAFATI